MDDINLKIKEANELKAKRELEMNKLELEKKEWERERKDLLAYEDIWSMIGGNSEVLPFYMPW